MAVSEADVKFIGDETLDFSILPSPPSSGKEEEVPGLVLSPRKPVLGGLTPQGDPNPEAPAPQGCGLRLSWGPVSPEKLEEILEEANQLAAQLEQCALQEQENAAEPKGRQRAQPSPRRETFVVKDSPVRALLPTVGSSPQGGPSLRGTPSPRGGPSPGGLASRLRSSEKKGLVRSLRPAAGKRTASSRREGPGGHSGPAGRGPASTSFTRSSPPARGRGGTTGKAAPGEEANSGKGLRPELVQRGFREVGGNLWVCVGVQPSEGQGYVTGERARDL
ncbi:proline/serine-rich coiled-coil protein 1 [Ornithorhynchus anatinus]|uniref:proline/serine-rich coiled-coil protein 1 n=1 Tax=Ornithorhynchus anatinus TaxID=9258 RepID=UPI0019D4BC3C|nr:proline/serine-rich coiled-coil protein 1 [Ornithorhynchus anatinus]